MTLTNDEIIGQPDIETKDEIIEMKTTQGPPWSNVPIKCLNMALKMIDDGVVFINNKQEVCVSSGTNPMYYRPFKDGEEYVCDPDEPCPAYKYHYRTAETGVPCKHIVAMLVYTEEWNRKEVEEWVVQKWLILP
tara:strand:- start:84 stop:485 length:402 start_codon:yes stop_codon:yes gene_type:complete